MRSQEEAQVKLVSRLRHAPGRKWVESYFDLVKELISFTTLSDDDPRLVMSLPQGKLLPITLNHRYVLAASIKAGPAIGFILEASYSQLPEIRSRAIGSWSFDHLRDERTFNTPYFLSFEEPPDLAGFKEEWKQATLVELARRRTSPYRKYHEPLLYQVAVDPNLREIILDEAFPAP